MAGESLVTSIVAVGALLLVSSLFMAARWSCVMAAWVAAGLIEVCGLFALLLGGIPVYTRRGARRVRVLLPRAPGGYPSMVFVSDRAEPPRSNQRCEAP